MSLLNPPLQAFLAIVETGTVHGAAKLIKITQTGVTQRIRALERDVGTTLFIRSRKGMHLTPDGEAILHYCKSAQELEGQTLSRLNQSKQAQSHPIQFTITGPTSIMRSRIIPQTFPLMKTFPQIAFNYKISDFENWIAALKTAEAQIAIVPRDQVPLEVESKILPTENFILVGPVKWKNRKLEDVVTEERIIDFDPEDEMTFRYLEKYKLRTTARKDRIFVNSMESLTEMIEAGLGYGVVAEEFLDHFKTKVVPLNGGKPLAHQMAACWYHRPVMPEYFAAILKALVK